MSKKEQAAVDVPGWAAQQDWVMRIPVMQQSVLFSAVRGPDNVAKTHPVKVLMRWYRRCVLVSAFDRRALLDPFEIGGGSFTGPFTDDLAVEILGEKPRGSQGQRKALDAMRAVYLGHVDELPHHFQLHFMHAAQIVGVHHSEPWIREWWKDFYLMIVDDAHLQPESDDDMNRRLSDNEPDWAARETTAAR